MKKLTILIVLSLLPVAAHARSYPVERSQARIEKTPAYQHAAMKLTKDAPQGTCYYSMKGCDKKVYKENNLMPAVEHKPSAYPKQGYVLGPNGMYVFKPGVQSRN